MIRALVVLAVVAGCTDRYGAYLEVDGRSGIAFDRVEFFFGKYIDDKLPVTPGTPVASPAVVIKGSLFKRAFEASDVQQLDARDTTFVYYLGPNGQEQYLGAYVVAVAFAGATPVGIAELTEFVIPGDAVYEYPMPLVAFPADAAELWGNTKADCVRWTRTRDGDTAHTTFAVVRGEDHDCDGFSDEVDCATLEYCPDASATCAGRSPCFTDDICTIGACTNVRGTPTAPQKCLAPAMGLGVCLGMTACTACKDAPDPETCLNEATFTHPEITIPVTAQERLYSPTYPITFVLPNTRICENPHIDLPIGGQWPDGFMIGVTKDPQNPAACKLGLIEPPGGAKFTGNHHVVLSVTDSATIDRASILFGLLPKLEPCNTPPTVQTDGAEYGRCNP